MKSIRRGLSDGEVEKNTAGRFSCRICRRPLEAETTTQQSPSSNRNAERSADTDGSATRDGVTVRSCPDCGRAWRSA